MSSPSSSSPSLSSPSLPEKDGGDSESNIDSDSIGGYIRTATHNFVSRKATVDGPERVELKGKSVLHDDVVVRGDVARIQLGRYVTIGCGTKLVPSDQQIPMVIRGHVLVGNCCDIQAAAIGCFVKIGNDCKIGKRCLIKDVVIIEDGTVLGDDTVIPPFSRVSGRPGRVVEELPPATATDLQNAAFHTYQSFVQQQQQQTDNR